MRRRNWPCCASPRRLSGTVARVNVKPGQAVDMTTVVAEVIDLNRLAVSAEIPAAEASEVQIGNPVEVLAEPPVTTELFVRQPERGQGTTTRFWSGRHCLPTADCGPDNLSHCASSQRSTRIVWPPQAKAW